MIIGVRIARASKVPDYIPQCSVESGVVLLHLSLKRWLILKQLEISLGFVEQKAASLKTEMVTLNDAT